VTGDAMSRREKIMATLKCGHQSPDNLGRVQYGGLLFALDHPERLRQELSLDEAELTSLGRV